MGRPGREVYTHSHHAVVVAAHARRTAEEAAGFLIPHLEPGMSVLDLGCGPGSITVGLARYVAPAPVVGIDRASPPLVHARAHAAEERMANVTFVRAEAYRLPFADAAFDVVFAHQLLQHLADPVAVLREARRVLRPGGYVAVRDADYGTMTHYPNDAALERWLTIYRHLARANGGEPDAGRRVLEWVTAAGFAHVHPSTSTWEFATLQERRWWADLWAQRLERAELMERPVELGLTTRDEVAAMAEAFRRWADQPTGWFAFIHGEAIGQRPDGEPSPAG